jgi:prepilin-type N-terminal cleavage/methylation domain-containing protein
VRHGERLGDPDVLRRSRDAERGFTLIELIMSVAILGLVFGALVSVMFGVLTTNRESRARLDETRDEQFSSAVLSDDVQSMTTMTVGASARCGSGTSFLEFEGRSFDASGVDTITVVSYVASTAGSGAAARGTVTRSACEAALSPPPTFPLTPARQQTVARTLVAGTAPAVTCTPSPCGAATTSVSVTFTRASTGDPFTIKGSRRTTP